MAEESELSGSLELLAPDIENPFNLPEVERQMCRVSWYRAGHSTLVIRAFLDDFYHSKFIEFSSVAYFSGPMFWVGAGFRQMSADRVLEMMRQLDEFSNPKNADFLPMGIGGIELLTKGGIVIRILARSFSVWNSFDHSSF